jgi:eukaryotic-like serine/threonine-protein kinase
MRPTLDVLREAVADRYDIEREIGHGAMSRVYLAAPAGGGPRVALKVLRPELAVVVGASRFHREIQILGRLTHPGIVPVVESGTAGSLLYLVMPYIAGEDLHARLARAGQLPIAEALAIASDLAAAIDYAHGQGIVHRDIKPANVLLEGSRALVCDFGLALALDRAAVEPFSSSGLVIGTPAYMSPEQATGQDTVGTPADIYALGCVLYEMLAGELPFTGATPQAVIARQVSAPAPPIRTVRPEVPARVEAAVMAALAKEPEERPGSGAELLSRAGT